MPAVLGGSGLRVGDEAFAVGHPLGLVGSLSAGVISGLDRSIPIGDGQTLRGLIQFDAAVNPRQLGWAAAQPRRAGDRHRHRARQPVRAGLLHRHRLRRPDRRRHAAAREGRRCDTTETARPCDHPLASPTPMEHVVYQVKKFIVGQDALLERLIVALLARGHILVEGVPGLAKTMAIKTLAQSIGGQFQRIQFTPDLVPADLVGTRIYNQKLGEFQTSLGPVHTNLLLADEINRAPAKVQSALLEVMQERQVTIGRETRAVPEPFLVLATQNPIESEGTYPLPEAQLDRFMLKVLVGYPTPTEEFVIVERMTGALEPTQRVIDTDAARSSSSGWPTRCTSTRR